MKGQNKVFQKVDIASYALKMCVKRVFVVYFR